MFQLSYIIISRLLTTVAGMVSCRIHSYVSIHRYHCLIKSTKVLNTTIAAINYTCCCELARKPLTAYQLITRVGLALHLLFALMAWPINIQYLFWHN